MAKELFAAPEIPNDAGGLDGKPAGSREILPKTQTAAMLTFSLTSICMIRRSRSSGRICSRFFLLPACSAPCAPAMAFSAD